MIEVREHLTERFTRSRAKLEFRRGLTPLVWTLVGAAIGIAAGAYILGHIGGGVGEARDVRFAVADATGVVAQRAEVRFYGIQAGNVTKVEYRDGQAVVTASVAKKFGPIFKDARVQVRPNTPLQDMYLDIVNRGTKRAGPVGSAVVQQDRSTVAVNVADVLQVFEPGTRNRLRRMLTSLGGGLDGRSDELRRAFTLIGPLVKSAARVTDEVAARDELTRKLVRNTAVLTDVLADRERRLRQLVADGSASLEALNTRSGRSLDATLRELPAVMSSVDSSFTSVRGVLGDVDRAADRLQPVAEELDTALPAVRSLTKTADPAVAALRRPVKELVPLSRALRPLSAGLLRTVDALSPQLGSIAKVTTSLADCPLSFYGFFQWTASVTKFNDARGTYPRGDFAFGADSVGGVRDPQVAPSPSCLPGTVKRAEP
jgi:virulence factor Mce-like protein